MFHLCGMLCPLIFTRLPHPIFLASDTFLPLRKKEKEREKEKSLSHVRLFATPYQAPPSMGFSRQEYWSGLPFPSPGDLPDPGIEPGSPALEADTLTSEPPGKPTTLPLFSVPTQLCFFPQGPWLVGSILHSYLFIMCLLPLNVCKLLEGRNLVHFAHFPILSPGTY